MKYKVSESRMKFLRDKFFEHSFKNITLDIDTLNHISEPIELDFIAKNHNYDDGNAILLIIVNNPNCDLSTLKLIFFRADIEGFINFKRNSDDYELIQTIIEIFDKNPNIAEKFYYDPTEDSDALEFDIESAKKIFPAALFGKPKGKKIEPSFAEKISRRAISKNQEIKIEKKEKYIVVTTQNSSFKYKYPDSFQTVNSEIVNQFIDDYKFPLDLKTKFLVSEKELRKALVKPEIVLKNKNSIIVLFIFSCEPLRLENAVTNVVTMMRNEFIYSQAFFQITGVEEEFEKVNRIIINKDLFAMSKVIQIKFENFQEVKYCKFLLVQKDDILYHFSVYSDNIDDMETNKIRNLLVENINIQ